MESEEVEMKTDSSSSDDDEDDELVKRAEELERQLSSNKYLYDVHVELIDFYRKLLDLSSFRAACERFRECYPLTPSLWLSWIKTEMTIASSKSEKDHIVSLFDLAVQDYLSVELWQEYAQFSIGAFDISRVREIIERGLNAAGVHTKEGSLLWDTLRELELAHLSVAEKGTEEYQKQVERVYEIFRRQLSVPLMDMENTYEEFKQWVSILPEGHNLDLQAVDWGYNRALKLLEKYKPFEQRLLSTENEHEIQEIFKEYIKAVTDPSTVLCLYERAIVQLCLIPSVWLDYCSYAMKLGDAALSVSQRAVRNCPWSEDLWINRLHICELQKQDEKIVLQCFEDGITSLGQNTLELWLSYLSYVKRNLNSDDRLNKLFAQAIEQFRYEGDPTCKVIRYHARILARRSDMTTARSLWKDILRRDENRGVWNVWLEYVYLERQYGDFSQLRNVFQRALAAVKDWPQFIAEEWLMFEREFGTLDDVVKCLEKCRQLIPNVTSSWSQNPVSSKNGDKKDPKKGAERERSRKRPASNGATVEDNAKRQKLVKPSVKPERKMFVQHDPKKTVFVSNLYSSVTEDDLKKAFPDAEKVDLVTDKKGVSRCYGYIQFSNEDDVTPALTRDRELLKGRPMFISKCKSTEKTENPAFKYSTREEPNKLFIKGLPLTYTKTDLENLYNPFGVVDVRIITHKSGQPKGLAYVEFPDDKSAQEAIKATDQKDLDGHVITVAISAPPPKKTMKEKEKEPIRHARSRLQVPLIPRIVQTKAPESSGGSSKSNADFRKMFLNK